MKSLDWKIERTPKRLGEWELTSKGLVPAIAIDARSGETGTGSTRRAKARAEGIAKLRLVA